MLGKQFYRPIPEDAPHLVGCLPQENPGSIPALHEGGHVTQTSNLSIGEVESEGQKFKVIPKLQIWLCEEFEASTSD